jgi:hypothetical protein
MAKGLDAGNAYVTVTVDTSQFSRGLNTSVRKSLKGAEGDANKSMSGIAGAAMGLTKVGALAVGAAAVGAIGAIGKLGMEYQNSLNIFQAATSGTAAQMEKVRTVAKALGNDITLPGVSAKDAALAMTELAKGGLSVESSMRAAKGTLQLATAAQIDGAAAAEIQANALAMFGLKADAAAHVADVLANVANAASGEIISKEDLNNNQYYLRLQGGGKIRFSVAGTLLNGATTLSPNIWYLATGTYDGSSIKVYVNGVLEATAPATLSMTDNGLGVRLGARQWQYNTPLTFNGLIDDVRIYNRALSQAEIQALLNAGPSAAGGDDAF